MAIAVAAGAAVGAPCRYLLDRLIMRRVEVRQGGQPPAFPWGLLGVNLLGCLLLGVISGVAGRREVPAALLLALTTGWCGAFTTYSSFGYDTVRLARLRRHRLAVANALVTVLGGLAAAALGVGLGVALVAGPASWFA
jgi:fluoride exporter